MSIYVYVVTQLGVANGSRKERTKRKNRGKEERDRERNGGRLFLPKTTRGGVDYLVTRATHPKTLMLVSKTETTRSLS